MGSSVLIKPAFHPFLFRGTEDWQHRIYLGGEKMIKLFSILVAMAIFFLSAASELFAQRYPNRAITLVIPMAPGDGLDIAGRLMAEKLSNLLRVPVTPLNKPGASGTQGADMVVKSKKDGYTIVFTNASSIIYTKVLQPDIVPYDSFKDLTPLGLSTIWPMVVVFRSNAPFKNLKELLEYEKKNPGKVRCGTLGIKSIGDINIELFQMVIGTEMPVVPFKGASPGVTALLGGHIDIYSTSLAAVINHVRSGELKGITISNSFPEFPDIPTLKQLGYKQNMFDVWGAFMAPAGVPTEVTETLVPAIEKAVIDPTISSKLVNFGIYQEYASPEKLLIKMGEEQKMVEEFAKKFGMVK
jgi:tripartite-type tricarboxylate transporter receptor subunit TctC